MDLFDVKDLAIKKLRSGEHDIIVPENVVSKVTSAFNILIEANSKENLGTDNGLQCNNEYACHFLVGESGSVYFMLQIVTSYCAIEFGSGKNFMYELMKTADDVIIDSEFRKAGDGYEEDGYLTVINLCYVVEGKNHE